MPKTRLTAHQRAELARMMVGQTDLLQIREEFSLEFTVETVGGRIWRLQTKIASEGGVTARTRLVQILMAFDEQPGITCVAFTRTYPPAPAEDGALASGDPWEHWSARNGERG